MMQLPPIHLNSVTVREAPIGDTIPLAGHCGFSGMEIWMHDAAPQSLSAADRKLGSERFGWSSAASPVDLQEVARLALTNGITIDGILPGTDAMVNWAGRLDKPIHSGIKEAVLLCARIGARYVLLPTLDGDASRKTVVENLREIAALARDHGVLVGVEPIGHVRQFNSIEAVLDLIERAAVDDNTGIVLDAFHFFRAQQQLHQLDMIPRHLIIAVQINDALAMPIEDMVGNRHREFPGLGIFDVAAFCGKVLSIGYAGPFTIEIINPDIRSDTPETARETCQKAHATGAQVLRVAAEMQCERRH